MLTRVASSDTSLAGGVVGVAPRRHGEMLRRYARSVTVVKLSASSE
jgi:hypothetical protein